MRGELGGCAATALPRPALPSPFRLAHARHGARVPKRPRARSRLVMKGSLLFAASTLGFVLIACSGASLDDDLGQADDELSAIKACQGKSCGDSCTLCPPGKKNCFETAVLKVCNAQGKCGSSAAQCGGGAVDAGPAPYQPCAGKTCGASCSLCAPNDPNCVETAVLKFCHSDGTCKDTAPACIPPPPPPPYNPCAG